MYTPRTGLGRSWPHRWPGLARVTRLSRHHHAVGSTRSRLTGRGPSDEPAEKEGRFSWQGRSCEEEPRTCRGWDLTGCQQAAETILGNRWGPQCSESASPASWNLLARGRVAHRGALLTALLHCSLMSSWPRLPLHSAPSAQVALEQPPKAPASGTLA